MPKKLIPGESKTPIYKKSSSFKMNYKQSAFPFGGAVVNSLSSINNDIARRATQRDGQENQPMNQSWMSGGWWNKRD